MAKFNVGDVVELTKESSSTGLLDILDNKGYPVESVVADPTKYNPLHTLITVRDESGCLVYYDENHFKLKENTVESNENHFKVGQTVWDVVYGKGEVVNVLQTVLKYPVVVKFLDGLRAYTEDGKPDKEFGRTLFFSEPKIIAETKPAFVPTFKNGDVVVAVDKDGCSEILYVREELERQVKNTQGTLFYKEAFDFYRLGEKIEFN